MLSNNENPYAPPQSETTRVRPAVDGHSQNITPSIRRLAKIDLGVTTAIAVYNMWLIFTAYRYWLTPPSFENDMLDADVVHDLTFFFLYVPAIIFVTTIVLLGLLGNFQLVTGNIRGIALFQVRCAIGCAAFFLCLGLFFSTTNSYTIISLIVLAYLNVWWLAQSLLVNAARRKAAKDIRKA